MNIKMHIYFCCSEGFIYFYTIYSYFISLLRIKSQLKQHILISFVIRTFLLKYFKFVQFLVSSTPIKVTQTQTILLTNLNEDDTPVLVRSIQGGWTVRSTQCINTQYAKVLYYRTKTSIFTLKSSIFIKNHNKHDIQHLITGFVFGSFQHL